MGILQRGSPGRAAVYAMRALVSGAAGRSPQRILEREQFGEPFAMRTGKGEIVRPFDRHPEAVFGEGLG